MDKTKTLFIGGQEDGKFHMVSVNAPYHDVIVKQKAPLVWSEQGCKPCKEYFETQRYTKEELAGIGGSRYFVMVWQDNTLKCVIDLLIKGYKPEEGG